MAPLKILAGILARQTLASPASRWPRAALTTMRGIHTTKNEEQRRTNKRTNERRTNAVSEAAAPRPDHEMPAQVQGLGFAGARAGSAHERTRSGKRERKGKILPILTHPDPRLQTVCPEVSVFDEGIRTILRDLKTTMSHEWLVSLSAPQVGVFQRMFVLRTQVGVLEIVNPDVLRKSDDIYPCKEVCVSARPRIVRDVKYVEDVNERKMLSQMLLEGLLKWNWNAPLKRRSAVIQVSFFDGNGHQTCMTFCGYDAVCVQHEIDHLDGLLTE